MTSSPDSHKARNPWWAVFFLAFAVILFVMTNGPGKRPEPPPAELPPAPPILLGDTERRDGVLHLTGQTNPVTGKVIERYLDGTLKSATIFSNGLLHGVSEGFFTNAQIQVREYFTNNLSHGIRTKWYADGATQSVAEIIAGKLHGTFRRWHNNGQLAQEMNLSNGVAHGQSRAWHTNGQLQADVTLDQGNVLTQKFWNADGTPHPTK